MTGRLARFAGANKRPELQSPEHSDKLTPQLRVLVTAFSLKGVASDELSPS
jgi:hypothetical protein